MSIRICSVGCGSHATSVHGPSLHRYAGERPDVTLAGCCDLDIHVATAYAQEFGFAGTYSDIDSMLIEERPDAVSVVVPEHLTAGIAEHILKNNVPVILEKPPGLTATETQSLIDTAAACAVPNRVAFNRRYVPLVRELKRQLKEYCHAGDMHHIEYSMTRVDRRDPDFSTTAIHAIDAVRFIAGSDYQSVRFCYQELPEAGEGVANTVMQCRMADRVSATINIFPVSGVLLERARVMCRDTSFFLNIPMFAGFDAPGALRRFHKNLLVEEKSGSHVSDGDAMFEMSGFYYENASFFDAIANGDPVTGGLETTLQSVEVAEAMRTRQAEYRK